MTSLRSVLFLNISSITISFPRCSFLTCAKCSYKKTEQFQINFMIYMAASLLLLQTTNNLMESASTTFNLFPNADLDTFTTKIISFPKYKYYHCFINIYPTQLPSLSALYWRITGDPTGWSHGPQYSEAPELITRKIISLKNNFKPRKTS